MKRLLMGLGLMVMSFGISADSINDLVTRDGLWYKKFSDVPFTGEVTGRVSGGFLDGKLEGYFIHYWENGQLQTKGTYKNGLKEGRWVYYASDGTLFKGLTGIYKNGKKISDL